MEGKIGRKIEEKLDEEIRFLKGWIEGKKEVGEIMKKS